MRHIWIVLALALGLAWGLWLVKPSSGHEHDPHWVQYTQEEKDWLAKQKITPEAQARFRGDKNWGFQSCCNQADRVIAEFRVSSNTRNAQGYLVDEWWYKNDKVDPPEWIKIPDDIIHTEDDPNMPTNFKVEGILFIYNGELLCFWAPKSGG